MTFLLSSWASETLRRTSEEVGRELTGIEMSFGTSIFKICSLNPTVDIWKPVPSPKSGLMDKVRNKNINSNEAIASFLTFARVASFVHTRTQRTFAVSVYHVWHGAHREVVDLNGCGCTRLYSLPLHHIIATVFRRFIEKGAEANEEEGPNHSSSDFTDNLSSKDHFS